MVEKVKPFSAIDVIMALLVFLPGRFPNNIEAIHRTINKLRKEEKHKDLLGDFDDFMDYPRFPYSARLERTLNILKGAGGYIELLSPGFDICVVSDESKERIRCEVLDAKFNNEQRDGLEEIAQELKRVLGC